MTDVQKVRTGAGGVHTYALSFPLETALAALMLRLFFVSCQNHVEPLHIAAENVGAKSRFRLPRAFLSPTLVSSRPSNMKTRPKEDTIVLIGVNDTNFALAPWVAIVQPSLSLLA